MSDTTDVGIIADANSPGIPEIEERICNILKIYPKVSPSMLQIALSLPAPTWKPVLEGLILQQVIIRQTVDLPRPSGRHQASIVLSLKLENEYESI